MRLWERARNLTITDKLRLNKNASLEFVDSTNVTNTLSMTELEVLDGLTASTTELNNIADVSSRIVTLTATAAITQAAHEGKTLLMADVGGDTLCTFTLPEATGSGARYHFKVGVVNTSNYVIAALTTDTLSGVIMSLQDSADTVVGWEIDGTDDKITLDGTTTGGAAIGDWVEFEDILDTVWAVRGQTTSSGTEATPASAT